MGLKIKRRSKLVAKLTMPLQGGLIPPLVTDVISRGLPPSVIALVVPHRLLYGLFITP